MQPFELNESRRSQEQCKDKNEIKINHEYSNLNLTQLTFIL